MRKYLIFASFLTLILSHTSCNKDFLEDRPSNILPAEEYVNDISSSQEYLNGIYILVSSRLYHATSAIYPDLVADNIKPITGSNILSMHYNWKQQADETSSGSGSATTYNMNSISNAGYKIILACNFILNKSDILRKENLLKANNILGQAYVIRGLTYLNLVNIFAQGYNFTAGGHHPGIAYTESDDWRQTSGKRLPVSEIYTNIIADFSESLKLFPEGDYSSTIINRYTAMGLLARTYLLKGDYLAALNQANAVIRRVPLMTSNYPDSLFTAHDTEALFQLIPSEKEYLTNFPSLYFRPTIRFTATQDIATILNESQQDLRQKWVTKAGTSWNITKFPLGAVAGFSKPANAYYLDVIRSSEMYLIAAESYAKSEVNPLEDSARYFLNIIRMRANPSMVPINPSGSSLLDSIYKERRKELSFEGYRMFDLLRWKKGVFRVDALSPESKELPYPDNRAIAPIPSLDAHLAGTQQNDGY